MRVLVGSCVNRQPGSLSPSPVLFLWTLSLPNSRPIRFFATAHRHDTAAAAGKRLTRLHGLGPDTGMSMSNATLAQARASERMIDCVRISCGRRGFLAKQLIFYLPNNARVTEAHFIENLIHTTTKIIHIDPTYTHTLTRTNDTPSTLCCDPIAAQKRRRWPKHNMHVD